MKSPQEAPATLTSETKLPIGERSHQRLIDLTRQVRSAAENVLAMDATCRKAGKIAIQAAIDAGCALLECKQCVGYGKWEAWLATHLPTISQESACRWMRLANLSSMTDLAAAQSLTEAYRMCGILRVVKPAKPVKIGAKPSAVNTVTRATALLRRRLRVFTQAHEWQLSPDEENQLRIEWEELKTLFGKLFNEEKS
jgi:hypothetical protein